MKRKKGSRPAERSAKGPPSAASPGPESAGRPAGLAAAWNWGVIAALVASLAVLLVHARAYLFLTDDAFISFRYARNLSRGLGLVFNPGGERVEGFSNFLWVLILAALDRVGIPPERAANVISLAMTVVLWTVVVWFAWRTHRSPRVSWAILVPAFCFSATRSLAVWSSSGLETRMFELFLVGGLLRLVVEIEAARTGGTPRRPIAPWLFALASLTRPDGLLLSASAFGVAALILWKDRRAALARFLVGWLPFAILIGGQFAFRRAYFHAWLPNTYYAKAAGLMWWDSGIRYLSAFALEYAAYLWIPLLVGAVLYHRRRNSGYVPLLFAGIMLPHMIYVAAIGGDHFEYRPLDLYFPLMFLLMGDGAREWGRRRALAAAVPIYIGVVLLGLFELPYQSHRQFPKNYVSGFPGSRNALKVMDRPFMPTQDDPIYGLPGLSAIAETHRRLLAKMTAEFVCVRQEEHRLFLATAIAEGRRLRELIEEGKLPRDFYIAMDCVGAIPYYSDVRVLDRLGLTDARVAHTPFIRKVMAHGKAATIEYARERGVDLWDVDPVHSLCPYTSTPLLTAIIDASNRSGAVEWKDVQHAAEVDEHYLLVGTLPQGIARASTRVSGLRFRELADTAFVRAFVEKSIPEYLELLREEPENYGAAYRLAYICLLGRRYQGALALYQQLDRSSPGRVEVIENIALCQENLGDVEGARQTLTRLEALVLSRGDQGYASRVRERLLGLGASRRGP